ncbi:SgcJ/EcaC family oxidoreductase [Paludisphaera mucosa]|uniref:SgcJ/EcaC family oxidoreductase n=1 Tax=Paludisphaera mucosa TaxID=3030827 RepID=A0ABT6FKI8_9BACT|nr:SgcJ/EcaC family oxidoreductase [Paludisphaera mucosa]MDG3008086.1 SgcJ/EcaC family oxidoreductase [Paludisphaera mucosa]
MKTTGATPALLLTLLVTALAPASGVAAQTPNEGSPQPGAKGLSKDDDQAVRKVVAGFTEAWNAHDMEALAKLFRDDAEWVNIVGMHWHGRDEIMAATTAFHQTIFKDNSHQLDAVETRYIAPSVAVVVATETADSFTTPDGEVRPKARDRLTYVLVKGPEGWKIAHGHNVVVDEDAAKNDPVKNPRK